MLLIITGSNGFVGKNLVQYLKKKEDVTIITLNREELQNPNFKIFDQSKCIIHLAGKAHDLKNTFEPAEYYKVNYQITKDLYDSFLKSNSEKFIFISSVKAAADSVDGILYEDIKPDPLTDYGKSKLMAEDYIQSQPLPIGKQYYILRPCMIHGPANKGNLNLLYKFVKRSIPYPLAGFNNKRSFLSIENLCFAIDELVSRNDIPGGIYQVADDEALSTNEVVSVLASSLNVKPKLWKISPVMIKLFAKIGDYFNLPLTTERLSKLTESYVVSNQKIKKALGKELPLNAVEGLKITANSFNKD